MLQFVGPIEGPGIEAIRWAGVDEGISVNEEKFKCSKRKRGVADPAPLQNQKNGEDLRRRSSSASGFRRLLQWKLLEGRR